MDVEKTIEFLLGQQARFDAQLARSAEDMRQWRVEFDERLKRYEETHNREIGQIRAELRRGVRLAVQESRAERKRRKEEDERLAAAQALTEKRLQQLIDSLRQPRNGHDKS
jgi:negative regulator of replication initiation